MNKYEIDSTIFEKIDSEEKAYWLGFILADGSIYKNRLKITLKSSDIKHLEKFKIFLNSDHKISNYLVGNGLNTNKSECCELVITNKKIIRDLSKYGITEKKSFTVQFPKLDNEELQRHLIRGIWDGDGTVMFGKRPNRNTEIPQVQICGNYNIVDSINNILSNTLDITPAKITKTGNIYLFRKSNFPAKLICNYLYDNSSIYLDRKHITAQLAKNYLR